MTGDLISSDAPTEAVPLGEAPGDEARAEAREMIISYGDDETRLVVHERGSVDSWLEADATISTEVRR